MCAPRLPDECAVLESRDAPTLPDPALWGDDRSRPCVGGHRVAISAGENRGPRGDRGARYGIFEPGRQHSHRGRSRVHRGSQRFQILSEPELARLELKMTLVSLIHFSLRQLLGLGVLVVASTAAAQTGVSFTPRSDFVSRAATYMKLRAGLKDFTFSGTVL